MSTESRDPELDAEQEVDLGRYARSVVRRWWLPLAGFIAGAVIGYLISLGGSQVWSASSTVYLGTPYSPISNVLLTNPQTSPAAVNAIVHSESVIEAAALAAHTKPESIRGGISTKALTSGAGTTAAQKSAANPLVRITVQTSRARKARLAANSLARQVVDKLGTYADQKISLLQKRIANDQSQLNAIKSVGSGDALAKAVVSIEASQVLQDQLTAQQLLSQAQQVEKPSVLSYAAAVRQTARSRRNSTVVGAFLGLLIGIVAALVWEPIAARRR